MGGGIAALVESCDLPVLLHYFLGWQASVEKEHL
jgi:hypothetical protein